MFSGDLFSLAEQSVLITGAGQGLGRTMALGLAASGANVAIIDINKETAHSAVQEIKSLGVRSLALHGDVTKEEDAKRAVDKVVDSWGRLDVLFNNAGFALLGAAEDTALPDFKRVYELDVFGMFICSKAAFGPMAQQRRGQHHQYRQHVRANRGRTSEARRLQLGQGSRDHVDQVPGSGMGATWHSCQRNCPRLHGYSPCSQTATGGSGTVEVLDLEDTDGAGRGTC